MNDGENLKSDVCLVCDYSLPCKSLLQASCQVCSKFGEQNQSISMSRIVNESSIKLSKLTDNGDHGPVHFMVAIPIKGTVNFDCLKPNDPDVREEVVKKGFRIPLLCEVIKYLETFESHLNKRLRLVFGEGFDPNSWSQFCDPEEVFKYDFNCKRAYMPVDFTNCEDLQASLISGTGFYPLAHALMSRHSASIEAKATGINTKSGDSCSYVICDMVLTKDKDSIAKGSVIPIEVSWTNDKVIIRSGRPFKLEKVKSISKDRPRPIPSRNRPRGLTR